MEPGSSGRFARLAVALSLIGLATSRLSLVGHELIGHALTAHLLGARIAGVRLYLFAGGWVSYLWTGHGTAASLVVAMGGVAVEVVLGTAALLAARWVSPGGVARVALLGAGTLDLLHAGVYLATGVHEGFGDGRLPHQVLGAWAPALVVPVSMAVVAGGAILSARLGGELAGWLGRPRSRAARMGQLVAAACLAGAVHGALTYGELTLTRDRTYAGIMQHQSERDVARDLARYLAQARHAGRSPSAGEVAARRAALERQHRPFPLRPLLIAALALACLGGLWRDPPALARGEAATGAATDPPPPWRHLAALALVTLSALGLVFGLNHLWQ